MLQIRHRSILVKPMAILAARRSGGHDAEIDRYIGYWEPYATSHAALDRDINIQNEVRNAARSLADAVVQAIRGRLVVPGTNLIDIRQK